MFKVSQKGARKWLEGKGMPATSRCNIISKKLKVNADWLFWGHGPKNGDVDQRSTPEIVSSEAIDSVLVPQLNVRASMGTGYPVPDYESVIEQLRLSEQWCRKNLTVSNLSNLAALSAYGDSMKPTFRDGDILLVDRGVSEIKIDAIYVLQFRDELYVKRIQRKPDGTIIMKSDNAFYESILIDPTGDGLKVLGRVVWAWNGQKL
jgi:phage repressor protein C with HTH and peptisase S24 domain